MSGRSLHGRFLFLALSALLLQTACGNQLPTYRYKLTVEVETPEGMRTGSSVIEVRSHEGAAFPGPEAASLQSRVRGQAVAVDLGSRGVLFALLIGADRERDASGYAWALLPNPPTGGEDREARRTNYQALRSVRGRAVLRHDQYPLLVRFRDLSDPRTLEEVSPGRLADTFGDGVRLRAVAVEMSDEAISQGIEQRLPWLDRLEDFQRDPGNPFSSELPDDVAGLRSR